MVAPFHDDGLVCEDALQVIEEFFPLARSEIRVGLLMMPHQRALLALNVGSVSRLCVKAHYGFGDLFPIEVRRQVARLPRRVAAPPAAANQQRHS